MFLGIFRNTNSVTVCQNSVFAKFWVIKKRFSKRKLHFLLFMSEKSKQKKKKWKIPKNPIKIGFFKVVIQKCEKSKNGFVAKIA